MADTSPEARPKRAVYCSRSPRPHTLIKQSTHQGRRLGTWGWIALFLGAATFETEFVFTTDSDTIRITAGATLAVLGILTVRRSRAYMTRVLPSFSGIPDDRHIVLFLRPFVDDNGLGRMTGFAFRRMGGVLTNPSHDEFIIEEEQVARAVDRFGQMVASGSPDDTMPPPGAQLSYPDDGSRQGEVLAALARAQLVLLTAGPGANLAWEVEQVIRRNDPTHLVVLISRFQACA